MLTRRPRSPSLSHKAAAPKESEQKPSTFEAKHRGGGSYSILDADGKEVMGGMSKEDAEAFNAMFDDDKVTYVEASKKQD